ncbi:MAG: cytochrome C biogenesis protein CycH [Calditrichaeota bacterium]|nr:cytochrome C biogenesis protein CycH [Calditrichota bacterium]
MNEQNKIVIYQTDDGKTQIKVRLKEETVWLNLNQMSTLFQRDKSVISRHIRNIFVEGELDRPSTVAKYATVQREGNREIIREIEYFNLDVIISVGYRVKSKQGTQFRIWATRVLRDYIVNGYALNQKRLLEENQKLKDLQRSVKLVGRVLSNKSLELVEAAGLLLEVLTAYSFALDMLDQYDHQRLQLKPSDRKSKFAITYENVVGVIEQLRKVLKAGDLFGREKDKSLQGSLATLYQTFGGQELYPSAEEKAAHLLYFVTKNHSFVDGNKRIAAFLFVWFLDRNGMLHDKYGRRVIDDAALVALTLMIAESKPEEKDMMVKVVVNLLAGS